MDLRMRFGSSFCSFAKWSEQVWSFCKYFRDYGKSGVRVSHQYYIKILAHG